MKTEDTKVEDSSAEDVKTTEKSPDTKAEIELSEEQWKVAFEHPRFKDLNAKAKDYDKLLKQQSEKEEAELRAKEQFKELAEKKEAEIVALKESITARDKRQALMTEAVKAGVRAEALDDVVRLVDIGSVELDEEGNPVNATQTIQSLLEAKPYLKADGTKTTIGADVGTSGNSKSPFWKWSEIQRNSRDYAWYEANKEAIELAKKEGRVNYKE